MQWIHNRSGHGDFLAGIAAGLGWLALSTPVSWAAGLQNGPWPMFHRDAGHTARRFAPIPTAPALAWSASLTDTIEYASPVIAADGTIYLGDVNETLRAFDPVDGSTNWTFPAGGNFRRSSAAIGADGTVYIGSGDGKLYAIRADGTLKWATPVGSPLKTSAAIDNAGRIYVGAENGRMYAFNSTGSIAWSYPTADTIRSSPAIVGDSLVVFGSNDGSVYAVRTNGTLKWSAATGGPVKASPAVGQGGAIIAPSQDGFIYAIWPHGALNWAVFTGETLRSSPAIGIHGKVYLGVDTQVHCYHDDGEPSWVYETGSEILASPAVCTSLTDSTETVIVGAENGNLYAISNGNLVWSYSIGSPVRSSPAIGADGRVYVGAVNGKLYAIRNASLTGVALPGDGHAPVRLLLEPNPSRVGEALRLHLDGAALSDLAGVVSFFDVAGREVGRASLRDATESTWKGRDEDGRALPSGVYLYRWSAGPWHGSGTLVRLR